MSIAETWHPWPTVDHWFTTSSYESGSHHESQLTTTWILEMILLLRGLEPTENAVDLDVSRAWLPSASLQQHDGGMMRGLSFTDMKPGVWKTDVQTGAYFSLSLGAPDRQSYSALAGHGPTHQWTCQLWTRGGRSKGLLFWFQHVVSGNKHFPCCRPVLPRCRPGSYKML